LKKESTMERPATTRALAYALGLLFAAPLVAQAPVWIEFSNQTTTRLPTSASFTSDPDEKDLVWADVDHDGDVDLIDVQKNDTYSTPSARTHRLLLNMGGVFVEATASHAPDFLTNPSIARLGLLADFNGDGWEDLIVVNTNDFSLVGQPAQQLQFYRNLGLNASNQWLGFLYDTAGRFPQYNAPFARFCGGAHGDFDQDGDLDLYLGDYNNTLEDRLLINDGTGVFTDETAIRIPGGTNSGFTVEVQVGDFNGDGWLDIARSDPGSVMVRVNNGAGSFLTTVSPPMAPATYTLAVGDLNNDGLADIYQGRDGQDGYDLATTATIGGTPTFTSFTLSNSPGTTAFAGNATIVDMDGDGFRDLVMGDIDVDVPGCDRHATILRNTPGGPDLLVDPWGAALPCGAGCKPWHTSGTHDIAPIDVNGDGLLDMVYAKCVGYACWIRQPPPMTLAVTEPQPGAMTIEVAFAQPNSLVFNLASLVQLPAPGKGPFFGLDATAFTIFTAFYPSEPFVGATDANGSYVYSFPAGTFPQTVPWTWQMRTAALQGSTVVLSNVVTATF
jgi:hypothetical protein